MGAGIFAAMLTSHLLGMKDSAKVAGYVCGVVLLTHSDHPWSYALYRGLETGLGIAAAFSVGMVPKLLRMEDGPTRFGRLNQGSVRTPLACPALTFMVS
jgi:hypothetical protein